MNMTKEQAEKMLEMQRLIFVATLASSSQSMQKRLADLKGLAGPEFLGSPAWQEVFKAMAPLTADPSGAEGIPTP